MMPKLDGLSVLKSIREQKNTVPVMLLTAKSEVDDKVAGLDRGADDYITVRMPQAMNARAVFLGDSGGFVRHVKLLFSHFRRQRSLL